MFGYEESYWNSEKSAWHLRYASFAANGEFLGYIEIA